MGAPHAQGHRPTTTTGFRFDQLTKLVDTRFENAAEHVTDLCTMRGPVIIVGLGNPSEAQPGR